MAAGKFMLSRLVIVVLAILVLPVVLSVGSQWKGTADLYLDKLSEKMELTANPDKGKELVVAACDDYEIITSRDEFVDFLKAMKMGVCGELQAVSMVGGGTEDVVAMAVDIYPPADLPGPKDGQDNYAGSDAIESYYYCLNDRQNMGCFVIDGWIGSTTVMQGRDDHEEAHRNSLVKNGYLCEVENSVIFASELDLRGDILGGNIRLFSDVLGPNTIGFRRGLGTPNVQVSDWQYYDEGAWLSWALFDIGSYVQSTYIRTSKVEDVWDDSYFGTEKLGIICGEEGWESDAVSLGSSYYEKWCSLTKGRYLVYGAHSSNAIGIMYLGPPTYSGIGETAGAGDIGKRDLKTSKCKLTAP